MSLWCYKENSKDDDDSPEQERSEIPEPAPLLAGGIRYEAISWGKARWLGQNGGHIAAINVASDAELWLLQVYEIAYDDELEEDTAGSRHAPT
ncbi:hypothetical protein [Viridibacterium curvum]|uniref:hypothetical protein n=1 Tax=Viridibacterium curvum TaxID=1101404 RepID=UPI0031EDDA1D